MYPIHCFRQQYTKRIIRNGPERFYFITWHDEICTEVKNATDENLIRAFWQTTQPTRNSPIIYALNSGFREYRPWDDCF